MVFYLNHSATGPAVCIGLSGCRLFYTPFGSVMKPSFSLRFEIQSDLSQLAHAREVIRDFCCSNAQWPLTEAEICQIQLAFHEAAVNIIKHAYQNQCGKRMVIEGVCLADRIVFCLTHWGLPFDRNAVPLPVFDGKAENGYGLYIIDHCIDNVAYQCDKKGANSTCFIKKRPAG